MTLPDLTHLEVRNQKAARTPKKTCPKCKMQVPVARQRCENCPHQFISNAAPDREARKAARKEKKRLRAHRDGIQAAAKRLRAAANERAANARDTVDFAPDLATHGSLLGWRGAHVAAPTEGMMLAREAPDAAPAEPIVFEPAVSAAVPEAPASAPEAPMPMDVAPDVPVALPEAPAAAPEAPMQIDVAPEAPAPALEVASARERAKYEQMQLNLRQEVAMWKKRSQRLSRGSCVVINELALLIEGGGDEPDLHEHGWGSEKEVAKSGPWKLDPIKNSVYKTHPRKEEAINLYQDWSIRVIRCFLRLGYDIDIGVTKQDPSARLGQKDPSNGTKKRMYALFQVEGKGAAQKIETDLQAYVKRLKYEGFTNTLKAAGNGVHEAMNTIYLVFWMKDEGTPPVAPDARPRGMAARASALVQSTLAGFLK
jgi:hypothetical protein